MCRYLHIGSTVCNNFGRVRRSFPMRCSLESILDDYFSRYNFVNATPLNSRARLCLVPTTDEEKRRIVWYQVWLLSSKPGAAWAPCWLLETEHQDRGIYMRAVLRVTGDWEHLVSILSTLDWDTGNTKYFLLIDNWCVGWTGPAAHYRPVVARSWEWVINDGTILTYVIPTRQLHKRWNDQWTWRVWQRHLSPA